MERGVPYVFVSYSSKNAGEAGRIRKLLDREGLPCWMAPYDIPAGAKYAHVIDGAIEKCSCLLLLLTKEAQESAHVEREIERAISYKKEIIPVCLDACALNPGFRYYLSSCQIANVEAIDEDDEEMLMVLERIRQISCLEINLFATFIDELAKVMEGHKFYTLDYERIRQFEELYEKIIAFLKKEGYEECDYIIKIGPDPLMLGDAHITVICENFIVRDVESFCEIVCQLDSFEVFQEVGNKVRFSAIFGKIARVSWV